MAKTKIKPVVAMIEVERRRQIAEEGYSKGHDDEHDAGELARAAAAYCLASQKDIGQDHSTVIDCIWPWDNDCKPKTPIEDLVRAGALIMAEIERLQRVEPD